MKKLIIAVGVLAATLFCIRPVTWARKNDVTRNLTVFNRLYKELTTFYVDSVDADKAITAAIEGMLGDIDPYTEYIPQKDRETFEAVSSGEYAGIGSYITTRGGDTFISEPSAGSPAAEAGLRAGDRLVVINGDSVRGMASDEVSKRLKGQPGTEVSITVWRPYVGADSVKTFRIKRRRIIDNSIPWHGIVRGSVGYIPITGFNEKTGTEFRDALLDLKKDPRLKALIIDLRDNGGGLVESAVKVLGNFLPKGSEVLRMRYKGSAANEKIYKTTDKPVDTELPLAVLINEGTASASEILAGAIQDLDRGIIVGSRSFGKGLVQITRDLPYNNMLKVTVAKYYIPSGRLIQAIDYSHRNADGTVDRIPDSLTSVFSTRRGRIVRDGGGITPDIVVPEPEIDRLTYNLVRDDWTTDYATRFRATHDTIPAPEDFVITDEIYSDFKSTIDPARLQYDKVCDVIVGRLREAAQNEGYMSDSVAAQLDRLGSMLKHDLNYDLDRRRPLISRYLGADIAGRYGYMPARVRYLITGDAAVDSAASRLTDRRAYDRILKPVKK